MTNVNPEYKIIKERQPHCPKCGERLSGNNSIALPYRCSCGIWKPDYMTQPFTFTIEKEKR